MQANQAGVIWTTIICTLVLLIAGGFITSGINSNLEKISEIDVPTAEDIAAAITIPEITVPEAQDTFLGVKSEKKVIAEALVLEEIADDDFREDLAEFLTDNSNDAIDIDENDITDIVVKDTDFSGFSINHDDETGTVEIEMKVYFDNDGDDDEAEKVRVTVKFDVTDLVYNDDYEDAEVDNWDVMTLDKCYGELVCD